MAAAERGTRIIVFTDLRDSTQKRVQLGDDRFDALRRRHDDEVEAAVLANDGSVVKWTGDGALATFSAATSAIAAAVAIQRAIDGLGAELEVGIGASAGDVALEHEDVHGTPVVEAARLCGLARGGQILVADVVRVLAGSRAAVQFESLGAMTLKGLPEPLAVFAVPWARGGAGGAALPLPLARVAERPLVGRVQERSQLDEAWTAAERGTPTAVFVAGEPGIGKTRLVAEVARRAHAAGAVTLFGESEEDSSIAFQPFARALRNFVATAPPVLVQTALADRRNVLARLLSPLADRGDIPVPATDPSDLERMRLFDAVTETIGAIASHCPVVLVVDDLHWADKPTLLLLRHLVRTTAANTRLLIVGTYRDTELDRTHPLANLLADLRRSETMNVRRLALRGITAGDVADWFALVTRQPLDAAGKQLADAVQAESGGNPFFVGEVLRHLVDTGGATHDGTRWVLSRPLDELAIPQGVREVVGRRLNTLSSSANEALGAAAVIGPAFDAAVVADTTGQSLDAVLDALEEAVRAGLVARDEARHYVFAHAIVRHTLEDELLPGKRLRFHRSIARALERVNGEVGTIARHYAAAAPLGDHDQALRYLCLAAEAARRNLAFEEAAVLYAKALDVLDLVPTPDPARRCDLMTAQGEALRLAGDSSCRDILLRAAALVPGDGPRLAAIAVAMNPTGSMGTFLDHDRDEVALCEQALAALGDHDSADRAKVMALLGCELSLAGDTTLASRALAISREAVAMARRVGDDRALGFVLSNYYASAHGPDTFDELPAVADELAAVAERLDEERFRLAASVARMFAALERGDFERALALLDEQEVRATRARWGFEMWRARYVAVAIALMDRPTRDSQATDADAVGEYGRSLGVDPSMADGIAFTLHSLFEQMRDPPTVIAQYKLMNALSEAMPGIYAFRPAAMWNAFLIGHRDEAQRQLETITAHDLEDWPRNFVWTSTVCGAIAWTAAALGDADRCGLIHRLLEPLSGRWAWTGAGSIGPVDRALGMTALAMGDRDASESYLVRAVELSRTAGSYRWEIESLIELARTIGRQGNERREEARSIARHAMAMAESRALKLLVDNAAAVLAELAQ